jgi:flagellar motor switch protein FliN/FliY
MLIDQDEINALLAQADELADDAGPALSQTSRPRPAGKPVPPPPPPQTLNMPDDPKIRRLLRIRVPLIVQLARRPMPVRNILRLAPGAIIEFEKSVDEDLGLLVNNRQIGTGTCVKVGENFGLRIGSIVSRARRIQSLGS